MNLEHVKLELLHLHQKCHSTLLDRIFCNLNCAKKDPKKRQTQKPISLGVLKCLPAIQSPGIETAATKVHTRTTVHLFWWRALSFFSKKKWGTGPLDVTERIAEHVTEVYRFEGEGWNIRVKPKQGIG